MVRPMPEPLDSRLVEHPYPPSPPGVSPRAVGAIRLVVFGLMVAPLLLVMPSPWSLGDGAMTSARGTETFYATVAQVLAAVAILMAIEARTMLTGFLELFGRDALGSGIGLGILAINASWAVIGGEGVVLAALQSCDRGGECASSYTMNQAILALICAGAVVTVSFLVTLYRALVKAGEMQSAADRERERTG
jgi:hypothetical protein